MLVSLIQLDFQLLHRQPLPLQGKITQGGVKDHQQVTLLHRVAHVYQSLQHGLGVGEVDGLDVVGGDGAVALLGVGPVFGHAQIFKGINVHRLSVCGTRKLPDSQSQRAHKGHSHHRNQDFQPFLLLHWGFLLSSALRRCAARRRECGRFCPRRRRWRVRG